MGFDWTDLAHERDRWLGLFKCGNECQASIRCGEFLDWVRNYKLVENDSALWSLFVC